MLVNYLRGRHAGKGDTRTQDTDSKGLADKWTLLLQIDSNEENEMMWADCGRYISGFKKRIYGTENSKTLG